MIRKNMIANLIGKLYTAGISFLVLPIYLKYLGSESYGLVGIFAMIQAFALLLDSGITPMVTREIARMKDRVNSSQHLKNLFKTTERLFIIVGLVAFVIIYLLSSLIATKWLNTNSLSVEIVIHAIVLMGIIIASKFNSGLYGGTVMALEKQISYNIASSILATVKSVGMIYILIYISNDILFFFKYQIFISVIELITYRYMAMKYLPQTNVKSVFTFEVYKGNLHFVGGYSLSMIFIFILLQSGNIVLSKILPLSEFGYYTFAVGIVSVLQMLGGPLFQAISPRLMAVYANDKSNLENFYHKACQAIAFLIIPIGLMLSIYSYDIILIWIKNIETTDHVYLIVSLLAIGTLLNILATMPGQLQTADGRTKIMVYINGLSIIFVLPMNMWLGQLYGAVGVVIVWIILNVLYLLAGVFLIHPKLLNENKLQWIWNDVLKPLSLVSIFLIITKYFYLNIEFQENIFKIIYMFLVFVLSYIVNMYSLIAIQPEVKKNFRKVEKYV